MTSDLCVPNAQKESRKKSFHLGANGKITPNAVIVRHSVLPE